MKIKSDIRTVKGEHNGHAFEIGTGGHRALRFLALMFWPAFSAGIFFFTRAVISR